MFLIGSSNLVNAVPALFRSLTSFSRVVLQGAPRSRGIISDLVCVAQLVEGLAVQTPAPTVHMVKCPWARQWAIIAPSGAFYILSHTAEESSLLFLSGVTCRIGSWQILFLPHCIQAQSQFTLSALPLRLASSNRPGCPNPQRERGVGWSVTELALQTEGWEIFPRPDNSSMRLVGLGHI